MRIDNCKTPQEVILRMYELHYHQTNFVRTVMGYDAIYDMAERALAYEDTPDAFDQLDLEDDEDYDVSERCLEWLLHGGANKKMWEKFTIDDLDALVSIMEKMNIVSVKLENYIDYTFDDMSQIRDNQKIKEEIG